MDDEVAGVVAVSAAVQHLGVQLLLHRIDVVVGGDLRVLAVLILLVEASVGVQRDTPSLGGLAFLHAVLADIVGSHVHGELGSQGGLHGVAGLVAVQAESVEAVGHVGHDLVIFVGLPGVGAPLHIRRAADGHAVGVHLFIGVVLAGFASVQVGGHFAAARRRSFHGDLAAVEGALTLIVGAGGREAFRRRGHAGQSQRESSRDGNDSLHSSFLLYQFAKPQHRKCNALTFSIICNFHAPVNAYSRDIHRKRTAF